MPTQGIDILKHLVSQRLSRIEGQGRLRRLLPLTPQSSETLDLTHNDYLAFRYDPEFQKLAYEAAKAWPMGAGASRLLGGEHLIYETLESAFSLWKGCETSLYFASGYAANEALMTALAQKDVEFFSDSLNHASLIDGLRLARIEPHQKQIFDHNDMQALRDKLSLSQASLKIVVTESLFSMDGDEAPLQELITLCREFGALLVLDEAHALGVYGAKGSGLVEAAGLDHDEIITINPCGKAMAASGAFVSGPLWLKHLLINSARSFIYSTGASPWLAAGLHAGMKRVADAGDRRQHLAEIASSLRSELQILGCNIGLSTKHIIPLILASEERSLEVERRLSERGILARAIRPPTVPEGECRLRLSLHAGVTNLEPLLTALKDIL
ncbi:MAG: 8-amino-7-oxononanoate synthase [Oligoflexus sp.]|nr:8-amino-7-oxononanoate synthase [Oligoflexus sp.]